MRTLVLDKQYQAIRFIDIKDLARYVIKDKVEVISIWNDEFLHKKQLYPSIVRLKEYVRKKPRVPKFNRKSLFRRDNFTCQYTGQRFPPSKLTIDHVWPESKGGKLEWDNCVTACKSINSAKGDKTVEEAGLTLLNRPKPPAQPLTLEYKVISQRHEDWAMYFPNVDSN